MYLEFPSWRVGLLCFVVLSLALVSSSHGAGELPIAPEKQRTARIQDAKKDLALLLKDQGAFLRSICEDPASDRDSSSWAAASKWRRGWLTLSEEIRQLLKETNRQELTKDQAQRWDELVGYDAPRRGSLFDLLIQVREGCRGWPALPAKGISDSNIDFRGDKNISLETFLDGKPTVPDLDGGWHGQVVTVWALVYGRIRVEYRRSNPAPKLQHIEKLAGWLAQLAAGSALSGSPWFSAQERTANNAMLVRMAHYLRFLAASGRGRGQPTLRSTIGKLFFDGMAVGADPTANCPADWQTLNSEPLCDLRQALIPVAQGGKLKVLSAATAAWRSLVARTRKDLWYLDVPLGIELKMVPPWARDSAETVEWRPGAPTDSLTWDGADPLSAFVEGLTVSQLRLDEAQQSVKKGLRPSQNLPNSVPATVRTAMESLRADVKDHMGYGALVGIAGILPNESEARLELQDHRASLDDGAKRVLKRFDVVVNAKERAEQNRSMLNLAAVGYGPNLEIDRLPTRSLDDYVKDIKQAVANLADKRAQIDRVQTYAEAICGAAQAYRAQVNALEIEQFKRGLTKGALAVAEKLEKVSELQHAATVLEAEALELRVAVANHDLEVSTKAVEIAEKVMALEAARLEAFEAAAKDAEALIKEAQSHFTQVRQNLLTQAQTASDAAERARIFGILKGITAVVAAVAAPFTGGASIVLAAGIAGGLLSIVDEATKPGATFQSIFGAIVEHGAPVVAAFQTSLPTLTSSQKELLAMARTLWSRADELRQYSNTLRELGQKFGRDPGSVLTLAAAGVLGDAAAMKTIERYQPPDFLKGPLDDLVKAGGSFVSPVLRGGRPSKFGANSDSADSFLEGVDLAWDKLKGVPRSKAFQDARDKLVNALSEKQNAARARDFIHEMSTLPMVLADIGAANMPEPGILRRNLKDELTLLKKQAEREAFDALVQARTNLEGIAKEYATRETEIRKLSYSEQAQELTTLAQQVAEDIGEHGRLAQAMSAFRAKVEEHRKSSHTAQESLELKLADKAAKLKLLEAASKQRDAAKLRESAARLDYEARNMATELARGSLELAERLVVLGNSDLAAARSDLDFAMARFWRDPSVGLPAKLRVIEKLGTAAAQQPGDCKTIAHTELEREVGGAVWAVDVEALNGVLSWLWMGLEHKPDEASRQLGELLEQLAESKADAATMGQILDGVKERMAKTFKEQHAIVGVIKGGPVECKGNRLLFEIDLEWGGWVRELGGGIYDPAGAILELRRTESCHQGNLPVLRPKLTYVGKGRAFSASRDVLSDELVTELSAAVIGSRLRHYLPRNWANAALFTPERTPGAWRYSFEVQYRDEAAARAARGCTSIVAGHLKVLLVK